jgi:hypothetical protein
VVLLYSGELDPAVSSFWASMKRCPGIDISPGSPEVSYAPTVLSP